MISVLKKVDKDISWKQSWITTAYNWKVLEAVFWPTEAVCVLTESGLQTQQLDIVKFNNMLLLFSSHIALWLSIDLLLTNRQYK